MSGQAVDERCLNLSHSETCRCGSLGDDRERLTLILPEPPSLNEMIDLAKQRDRRGRPTIYSEHKAAYGTRCDVASRNDGIFPPRTAWGVWRITAVTFRLFNPRDPVELLAGLKWPVDWLVSSGFVRDDSPRELQRIAWPAQTIDRAARGVTITIEGVE